MKLTVQAQRATRIVSHAFQKVYKIGHVICEIKNASQMVVCLVLFVCLFVWLVVVFLAKEVILSLHSFSCRLNNDVNFN